MSIKDMYKIFLERNHLRGKALSVLEKRYPSQTTKLIKKHKASGLPEALFLELKGGRGECKVCTKSTRFLNFTKGYARHCARTCASNDAATLERRKNTNRKKYGRDSWMQVPKNKEQVSNTIMKNHGVRWALQSKRIRDKVTKTCVARYGAVRYIASEEGRKYLSSVKDQTQEARENTWLRNYGVRSPQQVRTIHEKGVRNANRIKKIKIKGKTFSVRGYEPFVIQELVDKGFNVRSVLTSAAEGCKSIRYTYGGKSKVYHPDILLKVGDNTNLIEVKSIVTLGLSSDDSFSKFKAKMKAASKVCPTVLALYCKGLKKTIWVRNPHRMSRKGMIKKFVRLGVRGAHSFLKTL